MAQVIDRYVLQTQSLRMVGACAYADTVHAEAIERLNGGRVGHQVRSDELLHIVHSLFKVRPSIRDEK